MRSDEALREAAESVGVKALAAELRLSPALVYKWCQETNPDDPDAGGARNPLDRLADVVRVTGSTAVVRWICAEAGGFFVRNPRCKRTPLRMELLSETQRLVTDFGRLLLAVTRSVEDDGVISGHEADRIRQAWEHLKLSAEEFTVACEQGIYGPEPEFGDSPGDPPVPGV